MRKMIALREKVFVNVDDNIKKAQARYKKDFDKKRNHNEVIS